MVIIKPILLLPRVGHFAADLDLSSVIHFAVLIGYNITHNFAFKYLCPLKGTENPWGEKNHRLGQGKYKVDMGNLVPEKKKCSKI
jgi:hypothetical protein